MARDYDVDRLHRPQTFAGRQVKTSISDRLDALESRQAIDRLIAKYAQAFDNRDRGMLLEIWHSDAKLSLGASFGSFEGIESIMQSAEANWRQMPHMHHWMANAVVDVRGDNATGIASVNCLCVDVVLGPVQISGVYHDTFERREGRWGFIDRRFDMHFLTPLEKWTPIAGSEFASDPTNALRA
jgi:hypothetical protein